MYIDQFAVEQQARQLRAEAISNGMVAMKRWVAGKITSLFAGQGQTA